MARLLVCPSTSVWPSGADLAALPRPRLPPAPGRLSTTTLQRFCSAIFCATVRAIMSVPPPGGNGTIRRIGLPPGPCCASGLPAGRVASTSASQAFVLRRNGRYARSRGEGGEGAEKAAAEGRAGMVVGLRGVHRDARRLRCIGGATVRAGWAAYNGVSLRATEGGVRREGGRHTPVSAARPPEGARPAAEGAGTPVSAP